MLGLRIEIAGLSRDGDGELTRAELQAGLAGMNITVTDAELDLIFVTADVDGDGTVSLEEFGRMGQLGRDVSKLTAMMADQVRALGQGPPASVHLLCTRRRETFPTQNKMYSGWKL